MVSAIRDVTERRRSAQADHFLAEVGGALAESLDYEATLATIAATAVGPLADICGIDVPGTTGRCTRGCGRTVPEQAVLREIGERYPPGATRTDPRR